MTELSPPEPGSWLAAYRDRLVVTALGGSDSPVATHDPEAIIELVDRSLDARRERAAEQRDNIARRLAAMSCEAY